MKEQYKHNGLYNEQSLSNINLPYRLCYPIGSLISPESIEILALPVSLASCPLRACPHLVFSLVSPDVLGLNWPRSCRIRGQLDLVHMCT